MSGSDLSVVWFALYGIVVPIRIAHQALVAESDTARNHCAIDAFHQLIVWIHTWRSYQGMQLTVGTIIEAFVRWDAGLVMKLSVAVSCLLAVAAAFTVPGAKDVSGRKAAVRSLGVVTRLGFSFRCSPCLVRFKSERLPVAPVKCWAMEAATAPCRSR